MAETAFIRSARDLSLSQWWKVTKRVISHITDHGLSLYAAGAAFYAFLSLFPAMFAMVFVYGLVFDATDLYAQVNQLSRVLPPEVVNIITNRMQAVVESRNSTGVGVALLVSLAIAFWSGSRGVAAMMEVIGLAYRQPDNRSLVRSALLSIFMTIGIMFILIISLTLIAILPVVLGFLTEVPGLAGTEGLILLARWPILLVVILVALMMLYRLAPDREPARISALIPGALLATVLWGVMSFGFSLYVENFGNFEATFGAIASVVILLLWLNYSVLIIAVGAELNAELELASRLDTTTPPPLPAGRRGAFVADTLRPLD